jgi:hypothetical protein
MCHRYIFSLPLLLLFIILASCDNKLSEGASFVGESQYFVVAGTLQVLLPLRNDLEDDSARVYVQYTLLEKPQNGIEQKLYQAPAKPLFRQRDVFSLSVAKREVQSGASHLLRISISRDVEGDKKIADMERSITLDDSLVPLHLMIKPLVEPIE